jgi:hypothetical protein
MLYATHQTASSTLCRERGRNCQRKVPYTGTTEQTSWPDIFIRKCLLQNKTERKEVYEKIEKNLSLGVGHGDGARDDEHLCVCRGELSDYD